MKKSLLYLVMAFLFVSITSCEDVDDNPVPSSLTIKDFVWKGMNSYYLWQADSPNLADNRFATQEELNLFLAPFETPTALFNALRIDNTIDRFSVIYSDYTVLEGVLSGTTKNNGMDYGLKYTDTSNTTVVGWVRYIIPNSDAATKNIQRGDLFYAIDGIPLTGDNYRSLLANDTYTVNLATYINGILVPNGESISLTKTNLAENPILLNTVLTQGTHKIGYLMYNGFYASYDNQLNAAFGTFQSENVTDLVLDLRYNSGGSVATATKLASMITGQFTGQLFAKQQWNAKAQAYFEDNNPNTLLNKFVGGLNSLNLSKVYILTSKSSASASELVINCLKPYINVVQIGDVTTGKNVGSITLYDSPTFGKSNVNPTHKYAMQPIVLKIVNKDNFGDYTAGLPPTFPLLENLSNLGVLGAPDELLLSAAITQIVGNGRMMPQSLNHSSRDFEDAKSIMPLRTEMYVELK
ncbi:S41 family peptidase [Flavobacterium sp.]